VLHLGYNVDFIFCDTETNYKKQRDAFLKQHDTKKFRDFFALIDQDRGNWIKPLRDLRNKIEHRGFSLPTTKYLLDQNDKIVPFFPTPDNEEMVYFLEKIWENFFTFCEEIVVFFMSHKLPEGMVIYQVPEDERTREIPMRYKVGISPELQEKMKEKHK